MNRTELLEYLRKHRLAVQSSVTPAGAPQASVVGFVVTDGFEIFFDTLDSTRKCHNLRKDPRIAIVVGWDDDRTVQFEGIADEPQGRELERLQQIYFAHFHDGRQRLAWPGITYIRAKPEWIRYSDFRGAATKILEWRGEDLARLIG